MSFSSCCAISKMPPMRFIFVTGFSTMYRQPFLLEGHSLTVNASIVSEFSPDHGGEDTAEYCCGTPIRRCRRQNVPAEAGLRCTLPLWGKEQEGGGKMAGGPARRLSGKVRNFAWFTNLFSPQKERSLPLKHCCGGTIPLGVPSALQTLYLRRKKVASSSPSAIGSSTRLCRQALEWNAAYLRPIKVFANVSGCAAGTTGL